MTNFQIQSLAGPQINLCLLLHISILFQEYGPVYLVFEYGCDFLNSL